MSTHEFDQEVVNDLQNTLAETLEEDLTVPVLDEEGQLTLFEEEVPVVEKTAKKKASSKKKQENQEVTNEWIVTYAGYSIRVPEEKMTLGNLRVFLEKSFPELSKDRTDWALNEEEKTITPVVSGAKKG